MYDFLGTCTPAQYDSLKEQAENYIEFLSKQVCLLNRKASYIGEQIGEIEAFILEQELDIPARDWSTDTHSLDFEHRVILDDAYASVLVKDLKTEIQPLLRLHDALDFRLKKLRAIAEKYNHSISDIEDKKSRIQSLIVKIDTLRKSKDYKNITLSESEISPRGVIRKTKNE